MRKLFLACLMVLASLSSMTARAGDVGFTDPHMDDQALAFMAGRGLSLDPHYLPRWGVVLGI